MARFVSLLRFTDQGARRIKASPKRAEAFKKTAEKSGVTVIAQYWLVGSHDGLLILEAKKEEQALRCLAELAVSGNVRTETMKVLDRRDFRSIIAGL